MMPWYQTPILQINSPEMEWLQSQDCATSAVLEWYKSDAVQRGSNKIRELSEIEISIVAKRLGIDSPRFSQISQNLGRMKFIVENAIVSLPASYNSRTPEEDRLRKQVEYWKSKSEGKSTDTLPTSPKTSQTSEGKLGLTELYSGDSPKPPETSQDSPNPPSVLPNPPESPLRRDEIRREERIIHSSVPTRDLREQALKIYEAYPRKVAKPKALKSIQAALKKVGFEELSSKVEKFKEIARGADPDFICHPTTWFNQERFNDDPSTWAKGAGKSGGRDPRTGLRIKP